VEDTVHLSSVFVMTQSECEEFNRFLFGATWQSHLTLPASSWGFVFRSREDLIFYL